MGVVIPDAESDPGILTRLMQAIPAQRSALAAMTALDSEITWESTD